MQGYSAQIIRQGDVGECVYIRDMLRHTADNIRNRSQRSAVGQVVKYGYPHKPPSKTHGNAARAHPLNGSERAAYTFRVTRRDNLFFQIEDVAVKLVIGLGCIFRLRAAQGVLCVGGLNGVAAVFVVIVIVSLFMQRC